MMKKNLILVSLIILIIAAALEVLFSWELIIRATIEFFSEENITSVLEHAGVFGPLVLIAIQVAQVVLAPIPGPVVGIAGGYVFGAYWGTFYSIIGMTIGSWVAIWLTRILGRRFAERFVSPERLERFDHLAEKSGLLLFFLIFLLPFLPDDVICFVAGMTKLPIAALVFVALLGRLPGLFFANVWGESFRQDGGLLVPVTLTLVVIFTAMLFIFRDKIKLIFTRRLRRASLTRSKPGGDREGGSGTERVEFDTKKERHQ